MLGESGILDPEHEFVVYVEAPGVEVGRADKHRVVGDDHLGMEHAGSVFVDLDSLPEEAGVEGATGEPGERDIGYGGHEEGDRASAANDAAEGAPDPEGGEVVSRHDAQVVAGGDGPDQGMFDGMEPAARPPGENRDALVGPLESARAGASANPLEWALGFTRKVEHAVKTLAKHTHTWAADADAEVPPAGMDAITCIFLGQVEATGEGKGVIADQKFAMVSKRQAGPVEWVEPPERPTGLGERGPIATWKPGGTPGVKEHLDANPTAGRGD